MRISMIMTMRMITPSTIASKYNDNDNNTKHEHDDNDDESNNDRPE